ncbi:MAG: NAD-binding protein [Bacteroidia bacterium]|nr:NAD-binding protein [Bacteroidia bacterium]
MRSPSLSQRFRYWFDNTLSKGTIAIIAWLAVLSGLVVMCAAVILAITGFGGEEQGFIEGAWQSLMRAMDAGNLAGDEGWPLRIIMFAVTIAGIFIVSILIGTLTSGIEAKLEEMRKGKSLVIEHNHTLILGWSAKIYPVISELIIANLNQKKPRIVIMADKDKVEMEDEIRSRFPETRNTKIICRSGSPLDLNELEIVSPHNARSIVILSPESENPDTEVIKAILAITNNPRRKKEKYHIVAEIREEQNMEAARLVGNDEAVLVLAGELIARVTAQTCRQSGLSVVYTELLDFDGAEIYFSAEDKLAGKTYREALFAYEESAVIGLFRKNGTVDINPPAGTRIEKGDQVIAISEDDDTLVISGKSQFDVDNAALAKGMAATSSAERTLLLGWNEKGITIIRELGNYIKEGSEIQVVSENESAAADVMKLSEELPTLRIGHKLMDTTLRVNLESLNVDSFDHIIILCYTGMDVQQSDAKTLITLLHLRSIADQQQKDLNIVSEMLDVRNRELAEVTKADDFIVSDKLISLMLSQLSENKHLKAVFDDLFSSEGSEIYLKPACDYVIAETSVNFYTVMESALQKNETAIGYKIAAKSKDAGAGYGVKVNPVKSDKIRFVPEDKIIVLADN